MKKRSGRPKLPKGKANGILFAAKLSGDLSKSISALKPASQSNSEWLRDAATEKVQRQTIKQFVESIISQDLKEDELRREPSTLGSYPLQGTMLKLKGRSERLLVKNIQQCVFSSRPAYHIWFETVEK
jgi:hypothetical protein